MTEKIIELQNFSFQYEAQQEPTLRHINLSICRGEKVLIVGPSGSGKSTLGQCLNGIIPNIHKGVASGSFTIMGQEAFNQSIYDKSLQISTVLQDTDGQFIGLSVAEDLAFALENDALPLDKMREKVAHWAQRLELVDLLHHRPQDLSGGQKQRVSLAGVLIDESPILLFDEPLANLDPLAGQETIDLIDQIHHQEGATTLIIEHRLEDVLYRPVDRIILINDGQILFDGLPDQLLASRLLPQNGIREPLYLSVLRQLGMTLEEGLPLSDLAALPIPDLATEGIQQWASPPQVNQPLFSIQDFSYAYPDKQVLKGINLTVHKGERIALLGKNGAGKSTLAKALCQLVQADGEFIWQGQKSNDDSIAERAEKIGYVLQNPNHMISQTMVFDEVALGLKMRQMPSEDIDRQVEKALKTCGLYQFRNWPISALSFGQKKRVTIASILVLNPELILLDEPTAGQDQGHYSDMMDFLNELNDLGHTIIMITHDMALMMEYTDRALVISDGQLLADCRPDQLLKQTEVLEATNLKQTSLFELADKLAVAPLALTAYYHKMRGVTNDR